jgi:hypothetical protein
MAAMPKTDSFPSRNQRLQRNETLADYIARIEREVEHRSPEYDVECVDTGDENQNCAKSYLNPIFERHEEPFSRTHDFSSSTEHETAANNLDNNNKRQERFGIDDMNSPVVCSEASHRLVPREIYQEGRTDQLGDFEEERSEMSEFWRPNQFLRF